MKSIAKIIIAILVLGYCCTKAWAGWTGPQEIVTGSWGSSPGQFYFGSGDTVDSFPREIGIDSQGRILVNDEHNARVQVFNSGGSLSKVIPAPDGVDTKLGWPYNIYVHPNGSIVAGYDGSQKFFFDESGTLVKKLDIHGDAYPATQGFIFYVQDNKYDFYSAAGQLIKVYTERPLELGRVAEKTVSSTKAKVTVQYPDRTWSYIDVGRMPSYMRDKNGNLYGYGSTQVKRYTPCGKEAASLITPKKLEQKESSGPQVEPKVTVLEEYGSPIIGPNGDVYSWKRTPDKYSILKWTWVDDPNSPANTPDAPEKLTVKIAPTGINLFWQAVPQDPGCVTGYELVRATTSGGPYSDLANVAAGTADARGWIKYTDTTAEAGTTYYYKVRAAAGADYSSFSSEASGKR